MLKDSHIRSKVKKLDLRPQEISLKPSSSQPAIEPGSKIEIKKETKGSS